MRRCTRSIFDEIRGVWVSDETLSGVFDMVSSQSKQKLRSKRINKIVKKIMLIKTGCPNLLHGYDFL